MPHKLVVTALALLVSAACSRPSADGAPVVDPGLPADHGITHRNARERPTPPPTPGAMDAPLSYPRLLRRISLTLTGESPTAAELDALLALPDDAAREAHISQRIDELMHDTRFYRRMVDFGHDWLRVSSYSVGYNEGYIWAASQLATLQQCADTSMNPGLWYDGNTAANCTMPQESLSVEPWWAEGTQLLVRKDLAEAAPGESADCGYVSAGLYVNTLQTGCSCGPHLIRCFPYGKDGPNRWFGSNFDERGQVRQAFDEPARLLAHLVWNDRPLSDLVLGNYSVAPLHLKALYARFGRSDPGTAALDTDEWWRASRWTTPADPEHAADDPLAWHEFVVEQLNPRFLSLNGGVPSGDLSRSYKHDPRTNASEPAGLPTAGVLTMMVSNSAFSRERVRAARWVENLACRDFSPPPASAQFAPYRRDPATEGTCQQCHRTIDAAAIHFKRWRFISYGGQALLGGMMRPQWHVSEQYGFLNPPPAFSLDTRLTPVTEAEYAFNKDALLIDFLPPDQQLFGQVSDGTIGPLGFAKMLVSSGEFDQCATRRLFERFMGRPLDPAREQPFITMLTERFVQGGRRTRDLVRSLLTSDEFRRGM